MITAGVLGVALGLFAVFVLVILAIVAFLGYKVWNIFF